MTNTSYLMFLLLALCADYGALASSNNVNGIYFEQKGSGKPIVLIHGGQLDHRMWDAQTEGLSRHYLVVRYDIRGFGKSEAPDKPYSHAEDLRRLFDHLKLSRAALIGLSLGAAVATDFALLYPEQTEALVLVCPGLGGFRFDDPANDLHAVVEAAQQQNYEKAAELWLKNPYMNVAAENSALRERLRQLAVENARCWLNNPLLLRRMNPSAADRLREIRVPTLIVGGDRDVSDIHKIVAKLSGEISGAEKYIVSGAGHLVPMEKPEEFNRVLFNFLSRLSK